MSGVRSGRHVSELYLGAHIEGHDDDVHSINKLAYPEDMQPKELYAGQPHLRKCHNIKVALIMAGCLHGLAMARELSAWSS
jgi:hypothetical protein